MQRFKRAGWAFLLVAAGAMAAAQSADTTTARVKSNVSNNRQGGQVGTQGAMPATTPGVQENKIKTHSNSTNNREAQTGVTATPNDKIKTKSNIKNDRTTEAADLKVKTKSNFKNDRTVSGDPHESKTKSNVKNN
jgi:hypothetical protein